MSLATAVFEAAAKQVEQEIEYGPVIWEGKDGSRCHSHDRESLIGTTTIIRADGSILQNVIVGVERWN